MQTIPLPTLSQSVWCCYRQNIRYWVISNNCREWEVKESTSYKRFCCFDSWQEIDKESVWTSQNPRGRLACFINTCSCGKDSMAWKVGINSGFKTLFHLQYSAPVIYQGLPPRTNVLNFIWRTKLILRHQILPAISGLLNSHHIKRLQVLCFCYIFYI